MADVPGLKVTRDGAILRLAFNNPDKLNAFTEEMEIGLVEFLRGLRTDRDARVVVITGEGRAFCAGGDINKNIANHHDPETTTESLRNASRLIDAFLDVDQPVLARINGDAVGLGATIALFCDLTFAVDTARIGDPHVRVGLTAGDGGALIWPMLVGYARAKQYLFSGDLLTATEAAAIGLINFSVPAEELDPLVERWAARLAAGAPLALRGTKAAINAGLRQLTGPVLNLGLMHELRTFMSSDVVEAANAFKEKRKPVFKGE
jgi:enoyl-CoA hydratase